MGAVTKSSSPIPAKPVAKSGTAAIFADQTRLIVTAVVGGLSVVILLIFLVTAIQSRSRPFLGAMLSPTLVVDGARSITSQEWTALRAGLQQLDHVVAINGQTLMTTPGDYAAARQNFQDALIAAGSDAAINVTFERPLSPADELPKFCQTPQNGIARCQLTFRLMSLADNDFLAYFLIPYIFGLVTLFIGLLVFWLRPNQLVARLTLAFCVTLAIFMAGLFDIDNTYALVPFWLLATLFIGSSLAMLALVFPVKVITLYHRPWLLWSPLALNAVIAVVAFVIYFRPPSPQLFILPYQLALFTAIAAMIVFMIALLRRRAVATSAVIRDQSNIVLVGILLTLSPVSIWVLTTVLGPSAPFYLNTSAVMPFFIMPPIGLAYAVLQHRVVDSDKVISQGITYGIMLVGLIAGYFLLVLGAQQIVRDVFRIKVSDTFLIALTIFAIAVAFLPVRNLLQRRIDGLYFRVRSNYREQVEAFTRELTSLGELNQLADAFQKQLTSSLSPSSAFVFLPDRQTGDFVALGKPGAITDVRFGANSPLVDLLNKTDEDLIYLDPLRPWPVELRSERSRLMILKAMVIGRLRGQQQLVGFVVIGPPLADYKIYKYEQLRFLQSLTNQMAIAVERSQVVESLERRVRELDVLSRVGQAVNFVLGFDDLLELINTQTDQVVPSANFYIVLRDKTSDRLYFAFFLEDNERDHNKENRRWLMGRDLFSEVVRTENAVRVEDYMASMAQRNSPIIYENPNLRGWMGVPLIAGTHTLGVMAVAATESGKTYSNDQLRIFGDIASLAATSIDKAQLFAETNLRARQLSVLNDISRQLSSELKVDNLLTLITSSAVEILDAEAGSLLLMTDDGKELEFKVAVGSSGQDLVGKRFPAKRGLAGEVATTGKPVIVNDAANDPRWGGEVAKGRFSTTAVLAVPLIAQGRVIGVLEVLNKKSGGQYVKEDADLLTTFAGQAAIAIENARLFAATDQQLKERVEELQALERIDVELNRSLDLQKVADITRKWAIAQSGASAGLLGLVVGSETKQLRILSQYGYNEEDYPEGSEGMLWPLDRGVVSRVMRTRLPDLATDLKIDPDYVPSLQDALCQLTIPMLSGGEVIAMLILEKDREPRLNLVDMAFAQRLAEHASIALQNALVNEELTRANQSKSEFVSFVAHELKTPMTSIRGFADLLISGVSGKLSEQQSSFLGTIRSNVDRMNTLVSDLNDVTKLQTNNMRMEFSPIDFRNVVSETLRPLHKQIEDKKQILTVTFPDDTPNVMADQNRLIQVLTNLVSNAYKYTPSGGQITISGEVWEKTLTKKGRDLGPSLHIRVKDSGIGLSEHDQAKLFTPYFRSDNPLAREQPGTGLGLTITKGIIEQHGGMIWLESALGEGTAFHLTIPLAPAVEAEEPEPQVVK